MLLLLSSGLADPDAKDNCLLALVRQLPKPNFDTTVFLLNHLVRFASSLLSYSSCCGEIRPCLLLIGACVIADLSLLLRIFNFFLPILC